MKIYTRIDYIWDGQQYVQVSEESYDSPDSGQVALCKGASQQQNDLAAQQADFYKTMQNSYTQQFANQNNILSQLTNTLSPTVAAGPSQYGYSAGQTNALNSQAIQGVAQNYQSAQKSLQNQQAVAGGGNMALPSGVASQNAAALAASGANQTSNQLLGIQNAGYQQGNANYQNAISQLGGVASAYNPLGYAGSATSAGSSAANEANTIQQANAAASPWGAIGGLLGGVGGAFLGPMGSQIGSKLGSSLGGAASGGSPSYSVEGDY